jgi:hypothetical protein
MNTFFSAIFFFLIMLRFYEGIFVITVEIHVYPPLSYKISSQKVGPFIFTAQIAPGGTQGDLLTKLTTDQHEGWHEIYDPASHRMRPAVTTLLNGKPLSSAAVFKSSLSDGDQIKFFIAFGGG